MVKKTSKIKNNKDDVKYIVFNNEDIDILFRFEEVNNTSLAMVKSIIESMDIVPYKRTKTSRLLKEVTLRGPVNKIIKLLQIVLEKDYDETSKDVQEWDGGFDYYVINSGLYVGLVEINTRLFNPAQPGNIFYGRTVQRISENEYLLWVDD